MTTVTVYHNPRCSKSRAAVAYLRERGYEVDEVRYLENPPSAETLKALIDAAGITAHDAIRTSESAYTSLGLSASTPEEELIAAMVANPQLIERPIVAGPRGVVIARPTERIDNTI